MNYQKTFPKWPPFVDRVRGPGGRVENCKALGATLDAPWFQMSASLSLSVPQRRGGWSDRGGWAKAVVPAEPHRIIGAVQQASSFSLLEVNGARQFRLHRSSLWEWFTDSVVVKRSALGARVRLGWKAMCRSQHSETVED